MWPVKLFYVEESSESSVRILCRATVRDLAAGPINAVDSSFRLAFRHGEVFEFTLDLELRIASSCDACIVGIWPARDGGPGGGFPTRLCCGERRTAANGAMQPGSASPSGSAIPVADLSSEVVARYLDFGDESSSWLRRHIRA